MGGISSYASVSIHLENGSITSFVFGDFRKRNICFNACSRVTKKAIFDNHTLALLDMDQLIAEATEYYKNPDLDIITD